MEDASLGKNYEVDQGYLNFLREYRRQNTELGRLQAMRDAPKFWTALSYFERARYRSMPSVVSYLCSRVDNDDCDDDDDDDDDDSASKSRCARKMPACPKKPTCPKKPACPKKPTCPMKQACSKKPACPKMRKPSCCPKKKTCAKKPSCPMKRKPQCCPKRNSCPKKKQSCSKPGPVTNNGYLNFIRSYRKKHCNLKPKELVMKAARAWCRMSECEKDRYRRMACKVTKSERHKRRRVCTSKR